ncbi:MAG: polymer-forming cytoskeletal protein [Reinekea sp.]
MTRLPMLNLYRLIFNGPLRFLFLLSGMIGSAYATTYTLPADVGSGVFANCSYNASVVDCTGNVSIGNSDQVILTEDLTLTIHGDLYIDYQGTINTPPMHSLIINVDGDISNGTDITVKADLTATGGLSLNFQADVTGNLSAGTVVNIGNSVVVVGNINSSGAVNIDFQATVTGAVSADGAINVGDSATINGNLTSNSTIYLDYTSGINGNVTAQGDISTAGNVFIDGDVSSAGDLHFGYQATISGSCAGANPNDYSPHCSAIKIVGSDYCQPFDAAGLPNGWTSDTIIGTAGTSTAIFQSPNYSLFTQGDARVTTQSFDLSDLSEVQLSVWISRGFNGVNSAPPNAKQILSIEYLDNTNTDNWITLKTYPGDGSAGDLFLDTFALNDSTQLHSNFALRFSLPLWTFGMGYWHIDDICLTPNPLTIPAPVLEYRFDELEWNGTANEVVDSSANNLHGTADAASGTTTTADAQICRAASLNGIDQFIDSPGLSPLRTSSTLSFWIKVDNGYVGVFKAWEAPVVTGYEQSGGIDDIFWGFIDSSGHISVQKGNIRTTNQHAQINDGNYHHVVMSWNSASGLAKVFVDGSFDHIFFTDTGDVTTVFRRIGLVEDSGNSLVFIDAEIDEFVVFDSILSDGAITKIYDLQSNGYNLDGTPRDCTSALTIDHFSFSHDGNGINCSPEPVTLTAYLSDGSVFDGFTGTVNLSVNSANGDWSYAGSNAFSNGAADDGSATVEFTAADRGVINLSFSDSHVETLSLNADFNGITETSGNATASDDLDLAFSESGFQISTATAPDMPISRYNQIAATSGALKLRAVTTDPATGVCTGLFADGTNHAIKMGTTCTSNTANTCAVNQRVTLSNNGNSFPLPNPENRLAGSATRTGNLRFGTNSTADFIVNPADIGTQPLTLTHELTDVDGNTTGEVLSARLTLQVRPSALNIVTVDGTTAGSLDTNTTFKKAGESFTVELEALDANGTSVASFGRIDSLYDIDFSGTTLNAPSGVGTVYPGISGTTTASAWQGSDPDGDGNQQRLVMTTTGISYDEVGKINLNAKINDFLGYRDDTNSPFAISGNNLTVGRFYPAFFTATSTVNAAWGTSGVIYQGQPNNLTGLTFEITPRDINGNALTNFVNEFVSFNGSVLNPLSKPSDYAATGGTISSDNLAFQVSDQTDFNGTVRLTQQAAMLNVIWPRNSTGPTSSDVPQIITKVTIDAAAFTDDDGVCIKLNDSGSCQPVSPDIQSRSLFYARISLPDQVDGATVPGVNGEDAYVPLTLQYLDHFDSGTGEAVWGTQIAENTMDDTTLQGLTHNSTTQTCTLTNCPATGALTTTLTNISTGNTLQQGEGYWDYRLSPQDSGILQVSANIPNWLYWLWNDSDNDGVTFIDTNTDGIIDAYDMDDMTPDSTFLLFGSYQGTAPILFVRPGFR